MKKIKTVKYIDKALDSHISDHKKQEWVAYLQQKPERAHIYHEQRQVSNWLYTVAAADPPDYLKERILSAIPGLEQKRRESIWLRLFGSDCPPVRRKLAFGIAIGLTMGIAITTLMFILSGKEIYPGDPSEYAATLFSRQFAHAEEIDLPKVAGDISWDINSPDCMVRLALRPTVPITARLQFNSSEFQVLHFYQESWTGSGEVMVLPNAVRVTLPTANRFVFIIKRQSVLFSPMVFKLEAADSLLIGRKLTADGAGPI